jgi:hypothetical protein
LGDQSSAQQQIATQVVQPQQTQTVQYESPAVGTNEDNSVLKTTTQAATTDGATLQEPGATQTEVVGSPAGSFGAGSESIQGFTQQDPGKGTDEMKDLQVYNGPLPDSGQSKPQIAGMSPQEDVKIVNLGDDEKTATLQQGRLQSYRTLILSSPFLKTTNDLQKFSKLRKDYLKLGLHYQSFCVTVEILHW